MKKPDKTSREMARRLKRYGELVDFFYPVHYKLGMTLEAVMCDGIVSRTQAAALWLVASEIGGGGQILRKDVERRLREWYETSNSNVSKVVRDLARPPRQFLVQQESPHSGREKIISLTPKGVAFVHDMKLRGVRYLARALAHVSFESTSGGTEFFGVLFSTPLPVSSSEDRTPVRRSGGGRRRRV